MHAESKRDVEAIDPRKQQTLIRIGEYRLATKAGLRHCKIHKEFDLSLPTALAKLGRYRIATKLLLQLAKKNESHLGGCVNISTTCLKHWDPTPEEIRKAASFCGALKLSPSMLAAIVSSIKGEAEAKYIFEHFGMHLEKRDIEMYRAYLSRFKQDDTQALSRAQALIANDESDRDAAVLAAEILHDNDYTYASRRFACLALRHNRKDIRALEILALSLHKESRWKASRVIFKALHAETGDDISLLNSLIALPPVTHIPDDLSKAVEGFTNLSELLTDPPTLMGLELSLKLSTPISSEFFLAYEGPVCVRQNLESVRNFLRLSATSLLSDITRHHQGVEYKSGLNVRTRKKVKIGFISRFFSNHSNLEAHFGLINKLDRSGFEITIIHRAGAAIDQRHLDLNSLADDVVYLRDDFGESCKVISELRLDILFFTDIGMMALDSLLAMAHLAPMQITSWGLPHTTGVKEIDIYARSSIFRDCEGQESYTERLIETDGYIGYFTYDANTLSRKGRDYFLIPPDRFLVGCLQTTHKIHPDFDWYLNEIAKIDESILIVMVPSEQDRQMEAFIRRLKKNAPAAYAQLCLLQRTSLEEFYSLNAELDLNLDTIHYGAGITFIQTTWCGPPYITQHSNLVRASVVSRSYKYMKISRPPVAQSKEGYIELVRYYFNNRNKLLELSEEIRAKSEGTIYNNDSYIRSYEKLLLQLAHSA
jgi:predicted O-linked N-acetylglucosamine transferase (SPINDLY family)